MTKKRKVALFVDYESLFYGIQNNVGQILDFDLKQLIYGDMLDKKSGEELAVAYFVADWERAELKKDMAKIWAVGGQTVDIPKYNAYANQKSNTTDIITINYIYQTFIDHPDIDKYILVSGDGDYFPTIAYLYRKQKDVWVYAVKGTMARILKEAATKYIEIGPGYNVIAGNEKETLLQDGIKKMLAVYFYLYKTKGAGYYLSYSTLRETVKHYNITDAQYAYIVSEMMERNMLSQDSDEEAANRGVRAIHFDIPRIDEEYPGIVEKAKKLAEQKLYPQR